MTGIWLVLLKAEVLLFAIGAIAILIAGIVNIVLERGKQIGAEPKQKDSLEALVTEETERGIITKCSASNRCAAASGIMESEREREKLRKDYDELRERYENLSRECRALEEAMRE